MPTRLAILAAAAVATAGGGVPDTHACINRRPIPHLHTPCNPNRYGVGVTVIATDGRKERLPAGGVLGVADNRSRHRRYVVEGLHHTAGWGGHFLPRMRSAFYMCHVRGGVVLFHVHIVLVCMRDACLYTLCRM